MPMSTRPVLLGRVTGVNSVNSQKDEDQPGQCDEGVDIEALPSQPVGQENDEGGPSWNWRRFEGFIALLMVIFSTWLALALGSQESWVYHADLSVKVPICDSSYNWGGGGGCIETDWIEKGLAHDPSFYALIVSTGLAGLAAMWLYLIAPTAHTLFAAHFLCFNWLEGLVSLSLLAALKERQIRVFLGSTTAKGSKGLWGLELALFFSGLRVFLLLGELIGLQLIIQNRLESIWPALNRPGCKLWLGRCLWIEIGSYFGLIVSVFFWLLNETHVVNFGYSFWGLFYVWTLLGCFGAIPCCFFMWIVLVAVTLSRVVLMFHRAIGVSRQQGLAIAAISFQTCRGRSILQCAGVTISLATTSILTVVVGLFLPMLAGPSDSYQNQGDPQFDAAIRGSLNAAQCVNILVNAAGIILLSGASTLITSKGILRFPPLGCRCRCRFRKCCGAPSVQSAPCRSTNLETAEEQDWEKKTRELANRGISLEELIVFYKGLGDTIMPSFQPSVHTTNDVVRLAIIPLTFSSCSSYAELVNKGEKVLPKKMVTHNWSNLFRDLLASVIADAVGEHTFEFIAELLSDKAGVEVMEDMLRVHGSIQETFWICAFAVNQHAGICGENPATTFDPVSGITHPICKCNKPKFFNKDPPLNADGKSIHCEMNKFDDMMALLASENPDFAEVVAVDASLDLFGRAWCVAELAEAHRMGMAQSLKIRNEDTLLTRQLTLQGLKVENMKASRPEDVVEILAKIPDKDAFNTKLQELIFDSNGLLTAWKNADALQQMEEVSHVLKWLRLSKAVEGGLLVWQRWLA